MPITKERARIICEEAIRAREILVQFAREARVARQDDTLGAHLAYLQHVIETPIPPMHDVYTMHAQLTANWHRNERRKEKQDEARRIAGIPERARTGPSTHHFQESPPTSKPPSLPLTPKFDSRYFDEHGNMLPQPKPIKSPEEARSADAALLAQEGEGEKDAGDHEPPDEPTSPVNPTLTALAAREIAKAEARRKALAEREKKD